MHKFLLLLLTILIVSCETNPPTTPVNPVIEYGTIRVTSNVSGAMIFLNGTSTGKITPDTLTAGVGGNEIKLIKTDFDTLVVTVNVEKNKITETNPNLFATDKIVLIEDFANVSCVPCVTSNKIIEHLVNAEFGTSKLIAIKYPTNFPSPVDPFFLANSADCNARMGYYNILFAPTTIINGNLRPTSTDSIDVKDKIYSEFTKVPTFIINVSGNINGSDYTISISVNVKDISNIDFSKLVLHTVVTETNIEFATPPGSNGETKFYDVMRKMLPTNQGESLSAINQPGVYNFQRQLTLNSAWITSNIHTVVFIQNKDTREIYQAGSTF
ncbi:MAG: Omp28-related outer membrane protein [Ignavibacteriales bacterium]|nr:Omp28-related outer membrane protein [Ignavibacteriales bacterium]